MNDSRRIDLREVFSILLHRAWVILLCGAICGGAMYIYSTRFVTPLYRASTTMYVNNSNVNKDHASVSASDLATSQRLVTTYIAILRSDTVLEKVADEVGVRYTTGALRSMMTASSVNNTEVFQVFITHPDPEMAMKIANAVAAVAQAEISNIVEGSSTKVIDKAKLPNTPVDPNVVRNTFFGAAAGVVLAAAALMLLVLLDVRVKSEEDIARISDAPILGRIPNFDSVKGEEYAYATKGKKARKAEME